MRTAFLVLLVCSTTATAQLEAPKRQPPYLHQTDGKETLRLLTKEWEQLHLARKAALTDRTRLAKVNQDAESLLAAARGKRVAWVFDLSLANKRSKDLGMVQLSALAGEATEELQTSSLALGFVPPMDRSLPPQKQRRPPYAQLPVKDEPLFAVPLETGTKILVRGTITQIEAPRGDRAGFKVALIDWRLSLHQPGSTVEVLPFAKPK